MTSSEGTQQRDEFVRLWKELLPSERKWIFHTLIALQPQICILYCDKRILAASTVFAQYMNANYAENWR